MAGHEKRVQPVSCTPSWMDGVQGQSPQPQWFAEHARAGLGGMPFHDALKHPFHPPFAPPHYASRHASTRSVPAPYVPPAKKAISNPCLLPSVIEPTPAHMCV